MDFTSKSSGQDLYERGSKGRNHPGFTFPLQNPITPIAVIEWENLSAGMLPLSQSGSTQKVHLHSRSASFAAQPPEPMAPVNPPMPAKEEANHNPLIDVFGDLGGPDKRLFSGTLGANP